MYERNRAKVLAQPGGGVCWLCGHEGADQADHVTPTSQGGDSSMLNLRPAHGTRPCPTCGRRCNQSRGSRPIAITESNRR
ncbi:HNH endonuclease [Micromonospora sp. ALFpr18c]|nr:HNH endonuclease [Micromonospora sp. ALFpr18c]